MIVSAIQERFSAPKQRASEPIEFHPPFTQFFGKGIGNQPSHEVLLRENIGVNDRATRAIANRLASLNPQVKITRRRSPGTTEDEILDDHPLKALLDKPHPIYTGSIIRRLMGQHIVTVGESYWLKVGSRLGVPVELHPMNPADVTPIWSQGVVREYSVRDTSGKTYAVPTGNIIWIFFPDPENLSGSEGYLGPGALTADSLKFSGEHLRAHYQHDATPKAVLEATETAVAFQPEEERVFAAKWRQKYHQRNGSERGIPAMLPLGWKFVEHLMQTGADLTPLLEFWRDDLMEHYGVPHSILGRVVSGDRSSAETNQYVFDLHTVTPIARLIEDSLTYQLAADFDPRLFVRFEPFVSEDKEFELKRDESDLIHKIRSGQQVIEDRGGDPERAPWAELPVGKIGEMPYDPDAGYEIQMDEPGAIEDEEPVENAEDDEDERARRSPSTTQGVASRARSHFNPDAEWQRQEAREKAYVPSFERALFPIFTAQKKDVLKRLEASEPRSRATVWELFDPNDERWGRLFELHAEPVREKAFLSILAETLEGFGIEEFVFTDEMRFLLRQQGALLIKHANRTTQTHIARQLEKAAANGEGIDQIAKRIRSVFSTRRKHARTIARTEVLKASQTAQIQGFELSGVVEKKQWNSSRDAAVRDSHIYADGQVRDLNQPFDLAGEPADAPGVGFGGGQLSAGNAINCRCFLTPVFED